MADPSVIDHTRSAPPLRKAPVIFISLACIVTCSLVPLDYLVIFFTGVLLGALFVIALITSRILSDNNIHDTAQWARNRIPFAARFTRRKVIEFALWIRDCCITAALLTSDGCLFSARFTKRKMLEFAQFSRKRVIEFIAFALWARDCCISAGLWTRDRCISAACFIFKVVDRVVNLLLRFGCFCIDCLVRLEERIIAATNPHIMKPDNVCDYELVPSMARL